MKRCTEINNSIKKFEYIQNLFNIKKIDKEIEVENVDFNEFCKIDAEKAW